MSQVKTLCYDMLLDIIEVAEKKNAPASNAAGWGGSGMMMRQEEEDSSSGEEYG